MVVHVIWIVNKAGLLIFGESYTSSSNIGKAFMEHAVSHASALYIQHDIMKQLCPVANDPSEASGFELVEGPEVNIHMHKTPTGLGFIFVTDHKTQSVHRLFAELYKFYVDTIQKNPLVGNDETLKLDAFSSKVAHLLRSEYNR